MSKLQKGQSIVEFAFILPILVLFLIGLMYFGLMFSNYVALNNIARDAARSAAMLPDDTYKASGFGTIRDAYQNTFDLDSTKSPTITIDQYFLPNSTYLWDPTDERKFKIEYETSDINNGEVIVTLTAKLDTSRGSLAGSFFNVVGSGTLENMVVTYHMYSEVKHDEPYTATGGSGEKHGDLS